MKSQVNVALQCPYCKKPTGYHFTRDGMVYTNEIVGRFLGRSLPCVHCQRPIEVMIHFNYRKIKPGG